MILEGSCHCQNLAFTLDWPGEPAEIVARVCDCSFCSRHGCAWTSEPSARLRLRIEDASLLSLYAFATESAEFSICTRCGVVPLVLSRIEGGVYAVVNVNTFTNLEAGRIRRLPLRLGDEALETRLARRKLRWIADVEEERLRPAAPFRLGSD